VCHGWESRKDIGCYPSGSGLASGYVGNRPEQARVTWIGHATVLLDLDGVRLLTDPLLRNRVAHLRRVAPVDVDSVGDVDALLVSHVHYDHLDLPSLRLLDRSLRVIAPRGAGPLLRRRGFEDVVEAEAGDEITVGPVAVRVTHAEHPASRGPLRAKAPSLGFLLAGTASVYFAGDTDLFDGMAALGPLDLALLPVWGWGPSLGPGHLDPRRAAECAALLRARVAVPIHWGTYRPFHGRQGPFLVEPPEEFRRAAGELAPETEVRVLPLGGTLAVPTGAEQAR
jgi:L-ascorbate metabolism protein UlaG (beta-lactamase superfamily)